MTHSLRTESKFVMAEGNARAFLAAAALWFILFVGYKSISGGGYPATWHCAPACALVLLILYSILTVIYFVNRNLMRKQKWVQVIGIPLTPFHLTNHVSAKLIFDENHLSLYNMIMKWTRRTQEMSYNKINRVEMTKHYYNVYGWFAYHFTVALFSDEEELMIDLGDFDKEEWIIILKALREMSPQAIFNIRAEEALEGHFILPHSVAKTDGS